MQKSLILLAGTALGVAALAPTASAQTANVVAVEGTTLSVGGGSAFLTLPNTKFTFRYDNDSGDTVHKFLTFAPHLPKDQCGASCHLCRCAAGESQQ